jgi:hypothetical protein
LIRLGERGIREAFAYFHVGGPLHGIIQAFQMLHVQGRDDVDARRQDVLHVLVALGITAAGRVGMRQFIHQRDLRTARKERIDIHLFHLDASVLRSAHRDALQALDQARRVFAAMGFDHRDDHVDAFGLQAMGLLERLVGLAHARRIAQIYLETAAAIAAYHLQERRSLVRHAWESTPCRRARGS